VKIQEDFLVFLCLKAQPFDKEMQKKRSEKRERKRERATYTLRQPCIKNILDNRRGDREHIPVTGRQTDAQPV